MRANSAIALTLVAGLAALGLTACSSSASTGSGSKQLTVLTYQTTNPQKGAYNDFLKTCSDDGDGYTFKQITVPQAQLTTKATQLTASGNAPAIVLADGPTVPELADAGALQPLKMSETGLKASDFLTGPLQSGQYQGTQYGLPVGNNGEVIVYDKAALQQAGVTVPKSWAELTAAAKKLQSGGTYKYGFGQAFGTGEELTWDWEAELWSDGGSLTDLTSKQAVDSVNFWTSFIRNGTAPRASLNWNSNDLQGQFTGKQLPMVEVGTWVLPGLTADAKKAGIDVGITAQVSPTGSAPTVPFGGEVMAVGAGAKTTAQQDAVAKCIGLFSKDPAKLAKFDTLLGYVPSYQPAEANFLANNPTLQVMSDELAHSRSRTEGVGTKYNAISTAMSTALQQIATGSKTAPAALAAAKTAAKQ